FASDLATDLARFPDLAHWSSEDLRLLAGIFVNVMVFTAEAILDAPHEDRAAQDAMAARGRRELLMVILGVPAWRGSDRRATG
ncbi:MAG: TetR family transcriptional regulator, partial [Acidobacteriota bacterium]|nr:TetR family transcriptional regulator [Acidobacteriota bacterium]